MSRTRTLAAAPEAVWEVLADFGAISSWVANVDHSCLLERGDSGGAIGTARRLQVGRNTLVERITEFSPPASGRPVALAYDIQGLPRRLRRLSNRWQLRPAADGRTEVTLTSTAEVGATPLARLAERAVCRMMATQSSRMLTGLAERLEAD